ncbi:PTSINtr with GAF domain PtsP [Idiomarina aquatica]|uniref:phosphoenolpyruvate--protein phosphotransferase n=1 Tax=Idiomarina aquatica TaxID=1327752 RepID=A0A4V3CQ10_9GAMM|nr:phosphoenolpyruvate--protein phosphotransferase [Idiomarina aquatica]TDP40130.1 PTSINtr with GAF domain PtsP [Idiomarina aquatica]
MLVTLQRIVETVNKSPDFNLALKAMVSQVREALETDSCSVFLADDESQQFVMAASDGLSTHKNEPLRVDFGEGIISLAAQREEPLNIADASQHPANKKITQTNESEYRGLLAAPIIHRRRVLGIIVVHQSQARSFTREEEAFVVTLAAQLSVVIAHASAKGLLANENSPWIHSLQGLPGSPGVAIGDAFVARPEVSLKEVSPQRTDRPQHEVRKFRQAVARTRADLKKLSERMLGQVPDDTLAIFDVYQGMLDAASLGNAVESMINEGWRAQTALKHVVEQFVDQFEALDDSYLRERATDVRDIGQRVLMHLQQRQRKPRQFPTDGILIAEEVTASMLAELPQDDIAGIISLNGSNNSHAAIMARSMGIPAVLGIDDIELHFFTEKKLIVDGYTGEIYINPPPQVREQYRHLAEEEEELKLIVAEHAHLPAETQDGQRVSLHLNLGLDVKQPHLANLNIDGIGLYRSEIPFMMRDQLPTEDEQVEMYKEVLDHFPDKPVVMRTLDVGGDKPLPYLPLKEDNPFLGWRGIRLTLDHPEIFLVQVRAMLRASIGRTNLRILLPMVTSISEVEEASRLIKQAYFEVAEEQGCAVGVNLIQPQLGVMIEVPAIIYQLSALANKVDFFSVGSNDLTQYLLAVDRNNRRVAHLYDAYHPAVLASLDDIARRCEELGKPVSVCGELAGDPGGALLLVAMGYRQLSMNSYNIDRVRWILRNVRSATLQVMLAKALQARHPEQIRKMIANKMESMGLGGFVRAGK